MNKLISLYKQIVSEDKKNNFTDNFDIRRFGAAPETKAAKKLKHTAKRLLSGLGLYKHSTVQNSIEANGSELDWLHSNLADEQSKELLIKLLAYRTLGHRYVKLPLNTRDYWRGIEQMEGLVADVEFIDLNFKGWKAYKLDLTTFGYPLTIFVTPKGAYAQLVLQQYRCQSGDRVIEADKDDFVLDCGACYGETALYFAYKVGTNGRVISFEFMPENIAIFAKNMSLNPALSSRIKLKERPLWSRSGEELFISGKGPSTRVMSKTDDPYAKKISTLSIDNLVQKEKLERLDFIKMDIEGAEMPALKGAEASILRFRPKLAISVYHNLSDFWCIPQWLDSLGLGYRFYLRHFTIHNEETILFATPQS